ncbi:hypothetical protein [Cetobacterium sp.]|uniref:hypothetical protein n=1 Tax=Cetobacterium sp. TaxID=2071632 RepID=UPI003F36B7D9
MPLPFLLGALGAKIILTTAVAAGAVGVAKGVKGVMDSNEADGIMEKAERIIKRSQKDIEEQKEETAFALKKLGENKKYNFIRYIKPR